MRGCQLAAAAALILCGLFGAPAQAEPAATTSAPDGKSATAAAETPSAAPSNAKTPQSDVAPAETAVAPPAPPPPPPAHPVIQIVRDKLAAGPAPKGLAKEAEALKGLYATFADPPLWVKDNGLTAKGDAIVAEIRKAEDWGLAVSAFDLPSPPAAGAAPDVLAQAEMKIGLAALEYASHARGGRVDPPSVSRLMDRKPNLPDPAVVIADLVKSDDPAAFLRSFQPKHRQFELLRQALLAARSPGAATNEEPPIEIPAGPNLKPGSDHPHVALLRKRLNVPADGSPESVLDAKLAEALKAFQKSKGLKQSGILTAATRNALNPPKKPSREAEIQRLIVNMERWRWMPENLGDLYVWDNVPEFMTSVVKKGEVIFSEKIVVGKPDTPTPMFSADMLYIVFHPEWNVPDGIKMTEIWPALRGSSDFFFGGSNTAVLREHNLRVSYNGRYIDASTVDWNSVDIRRFAFTQPPGGDNVLGNLKFRFPNKHDVYMHDTTQKFLFANDKRAFSHGCMRVQNPRRLAEIILGEDQGMTPEQVGELLARGNYNYEIALKQPVPVHVNYFTVVADEDGKVRAFGDLYGHDSRIAAAIEGRYVPVANVADTGGDGGFSGPAGAPIKYKKHKRSPDTIADMVTGLFGN